jgi:hypothetical protein
MTDEIKEFLKVCFVKLPLRDWAPICIINDLDSQLMYLGLHRILDYWCTDFVYNSE